MDDQFVSLIFYVAGGVITIIIVLFGIHLYLNKKREGINYKLAIITINQYIVEQYGDRRGAKKKFCEDHDIVNHKSFIQAINPDSPIETPKIVANALNMIGVDVVLVNQSIYKKKDS